MKRVLTVGVFDYFHWGHLKLFQNAKKHGDYLIVAVQDGDYILKYKPEAQILYNTEQRTEMIRALRLVDEVILYKDVEDIVKSVDFDVFAIGEDQSHAGFQRAMEWCLKNNKEVVHLKRTPHICSSSIKANIMKE